jgi:hypothetical protein
MQYALLIYQPELKMNPEEQGKFYQEYGAFTQGIVKNGNFKSGDPLDTPATATTVRVRNGKTLLTDGPFAETKEQISGFYIVEAKNLDEAAEIASRIPSARFGGIEVRPIRKM